MKKTIKVGKPKVAKKKATAFDVFDLKGAFVRQYNKELHGENAEKYAQAFCAEGKFTYKAV